MANEVSNLNLIDQKKVMDRKTKYYRPLPLRWTLNVLGSKIQFDLKDFEMWLLNRLWLSLSDEKSLTGISNCILETENLRSSNEKIEELNKDSQYLY